MSGDNATFSVDGMGTTYQKMYLLISPVSGKVTDSSSRYDYSLSITRGDDPFPSDDDTADDDDDDDDDDSGSDDDDNDDGLDCNEFCQRVSACGLFDELGLTNDNCLDQCESASADAVQCVLDAADCDETATCVGVSGGDDDDDDDSSGGCS